jgi:hypothetical protein
MLMWPLSSIMAIGPQSAHCVLLSIIVVTAAALTEVTSNDALPAASKSVQLLTYEHLCHACHSAAAFSRAIIRERYERVIHGRLTWSDMVQLMALCSIIQGTRIWRRRSGTQAEKSEIRDAGCTSHKTASSDRGSASSTSSTSGKNCTG